MKGRGAKWGNVKLTSGLRNGRPKLDTQSNKAPNHSQINMHKMMGMTLWN
jgi:hypothetical protein